MTITISSDFTTITIADDILTDFLATPGDYTSVELKVYINCCETEYSATLESTDLQPDGSYIIDNTFFSFADTVLPDGVYQFSIEAMKTDSTYQQSTDCELVDQFLNCQVMEAVAKNTNSNAAFLYFLIKNAGECNCYCSDMCLILDAILAEINAESTVNCTSTTITNDCTTC